MAKKKKMPKKKYKKKSAKKVKLNKISREQRIKPRETVVKPAEMPGVLVTGELLSGKYCNVALIKHTHREFIFDFLLALENDRMLVSRVITSPNHAKKIHEVLGGSIKRFEEKFNKIKD